MDTNLGKGCSACGCADIEKEMIDKNAFGFCVATLDLSKGASRAGRDFGDKLLGKLMSAVMWLVFHPQLRTRAQFS